MAKAKKKTAPRVKLRTYIVPVEYTVRGTIEVEATSAEEAAQPGIAHLQMMCEPTFEIVDWEVTGPARAEEDES